MTRRLIAAPPDGQDATYIVPDTDIFPGNLILVKASYTTNADVLTRNTLLRIIGKSGNVVAEYPSSVGQVASLTVSYTWGGTESPYASPDGLIQAVPLDEITLEGGDRIILPNVGQNSGDSWSEWLISVVGGGLGNE